MTTIDTTMPGYTTAPVRGTASFNTDVQTRMDEMDANATAINAIASEMNTVAGEVNTNALNAATSASNAATSASNAASSEASAAADAATAADYAGSITATSTSSQTIGTGLKTFTIQSGKQFSLGQFVSAISDADTDNYMHGAVTSYSGTTLSVAVSNIGGDGTFSDWSISVSGSQGQRGETGSSVYYDLLDTVTASGASSLLFEDYITDAYRRYVIESDNCFGANVIQVQFGTGTTPTYQTADYEYFEKIENTGTTTRQVTVDTAKTSGVVGRFGAAAPYTNSFKFEVSNPSDPTEKTTYESVTLCTLSTVVQKHTCFGKWDGVDAVTAIKIFTTSIFSGTFKLYGIK